jgi:hypothetical protein
MRAFILALVLMANTARAYSSTPKIEPSNAISTVFKIAKDQAELANAYKNSRVRVTEFNSHLIQYKQDEFGEYQVQMTADVISASSQVVCGGLIRVIHSYVIKHPEHDVILERSVGNVETYANLINFRCKEVIGN